MKTLLIIPIAAMFLFACEEDSRLKSNPIDSKVLVEAREILGPDARRLTLFCKTEKIYPCINFGIVSEKALEQNQINVTFKSITEQMLCLTALGPATVSIDLGTLSNGVYPLALNNVNLKNNGTLTVSDTEFVLGFSLENGIKIVRPVAKRVPANTYWGTIGYHNAASEAMVNTFIQQMIDKGAVFNKQTPGDYVYYQIDNAGDIVFDAENSGYYFAKAFVFQFDGDEADLKDLIRNNGGTLKAEMSINVQTYKGEAINNWSE